MSYRNILLVSIFSVLLITGFEVGAQRDSFQPNIPQGLVIELQQANALRLSASYELAAERFKQILQRNPNFYSAQYNLALTYAQNDKYQESIQAFNMALSIKRREDISDASVYNSLGWVYFLNGQYEESERYLLHALQSNERKTPDTELKIINNLGMLYLTTGNYEESEKFFESAVEKYNSNLAQQNLRTIQSIQK